MGWRELDRRLGLFNWMGLATIALYGATFGIAVFQGAETWQVAAFACLGALGVIAVLGILSFAQAWVDERRDRETDETKTHGEG